MLQQELAYPCRSNHPNKQNRWAPYIIGRAGRCISNSLYISSEGSFQSAQSLTFLGIPIKMTVQSALPSTVSTIHSLPTAQVNVTRFSSGGAVEEEGGGAKAAELTRRTSRTNNRQSLPAYVISLTMLSLPLRTPQSPQKPTQQHSSVARLNFAVGYKAAEQRKINY